MWFNIVADYPSEPSLEDMELVAAKSSQTSQFVSAAIVTLAILVLIF